MVRHKFIPGICCVFWLTAVGIGIVGLADYETAPGVAASPLPQRHDGDFECYVFLAAAGCRHSVAGILFTDHEPPATDHCLDETSKRPEGDKECSL